MLTITSASVPRPNTRPAFSQFQSLEIRKLATCMLFGSVDRRISKLLRCGRLGRIGWFELSKYDFWGRQIDLIEPRKGGGETKANFRDKAWLFLEQQLKIMFTQTRISVCFVLFAAPGTRFIFRRLIFSAKSEKRGKARKYSNVIIARQVHCFPESCHKRL